MRGLVLMVLAAGGVMLLSTVSREAQAADFYANRKLVPGADAGTNAVQLLSDAGLGPGVQFMVNCADYSGVRYRICNVPTCTAGADDKTLGLNRDTDICGLQDYNYFSVYKVYDAGNPSCRLYRVAPQSKDCLP